jgi:hypothetical protein
MIKIGENRPALPLAKEWTLFKWNSIEMAAGGANRIIEAVLTPIEIRQ